MPEDPAMAERDPHIVIRWLADRVDVSNVPDRPVVLDLDVSGTGTRRFWLVPERGTPPSICIEDPFLAGDRYVFVEADVQALYPIARRMRGWSAAIGDGSVAVFGAPQLVDALPSWFVKEERGVSVEEGLRHGPSRPNDSLATGGAPAAAKPRQPAPRLASARSA
jgi:hypothetical protein